MQIIKNSVWIKIKILIYLFFMSQPNLTHTTSKFNPKICTTENFVGSCTQACQRAGKKGNDLAMCVDNLAQYCGEKVHIESDGNMMQNLIQCYGQASNADEIQACTRKATE
jgi:hypothetical protein